MLFQLSFLFSDYPYLQFTFARAFIVQLSTPLAIAAASTLALLFLLGQLILPPPPSLCADFSDIATDGCGSPAFAAAAPVLK